MLTCYYCSGKFKVISEILKHLQYTCPNFSYSNSSRVRCGELGCFRIYDSLQVLRMHYKRIHGAVPTFLSQINASFSAVRNEEQNVIRNSEIKMTYVEQTATSSNNDNNITQMQ